MADEGSPSSTSPAARSDPQPSIAEVQARILEQLQAARAVLTARSGCGSLPKDELAEVLEELSHSTALLATVKRDLDSMFSRLRRTRAALAAAFPQHAVAPRPVAQHEEEGEAAGRGRQQRQGQQRQWEGAEGQAQWPRQAAAHEQVPPDEQQEQQWQQEHEQGRPSPSPAEQGAAEAAETETPAAEVRADQQAPAVAARADQQAPASPDAEEEQQSLDAEAADAAGEAAEAEAPPSPLRSGAGKQQPGFLPDDATDPSAKSWAVRL